VDLKESDGTGCEKNSPDQTWRKLTIGSIRGKSLQARFHIEVGGLTFEYAEDGKGIDLVGAGDGHKVVGGDVEKRGKDGGVFRAGNGF